MALTLYNTLSRKKETFVPLRDGVVRIYVCGPTVYGHSHIGHGKSYVSFDAIVRYLRYSGYRVTYVQNITDVGHLVGDVDEGEDKLAKQGRLEQKHPMQIAEEYTRSFFEDMDALGVVRADIYPRATGHIVEQIEMTKTLLERGAAYEVNGSVYFDVRKFKEYGKLSGKVLEELEAGVRVDVKTEKRHPADFALWKKAEPEHIMQWPSPWGMGYPGWHIECSAMSVKYLGESFDIHGGGLENQFPHHECEIAQSECATGKPFVKYWLHNNMVTVGGQKMGKSLGNFTTLKDAFRKFPPVVVRFFILQSHYRSTLDFSDEAIEGAAKGYERLVNTVRLVREQLAKGSGGPGDVTIDPSKYRTAFVDAMNDDFNTPQAIAVLFDMNRELNPLLAAGKLSRASLEAVEALYRELGGTVLGIIADDQAGSSGPSIENGLMDLIVALRTEARAQKQYGMSDRIRDGLAKLGIVIEDKKEGTSWRRT